MNRWLAKTAVVTGAGSGMGRAIAAQLTSYNLRVVGLDIQFGKDSGEIYCQKCDLTKPTEVAGTFKWVEEMYSGVDVMVNCAGIAKGGHITNVGSHPLTEEELMRTYDVNVKGMVLCTRHAVNSMKRRGFDGHIININSIAGHYVPFTEELNVYGSTKYAVTAFTQSLAVELATCKSKIKTTSLSPGLVKTPLSEAAIPDFTGWPYLEPKDIAEAVIYVLSTPPHVNITELTVQPVAELRR